MKRIERVNNQVILRDDDIVVYIIGTDIILAQLQLSIKYSTGYSAKDVTNLVGGSDANFSFGVWDIDEARHMKYIKIIGVYSSFEREDLEEIRENYPQYFI